MKIPYFSINKSERAPSVLIYYGVGALVVPYMNLKHILWHEQITMEFTTLRITFTPPSPFNVQTFLESIKEQWLHELREENGLEIEVYLFASE